MTTSAITSRGIWGYGWGAFAGAVSAIILAFALTHSDTLLILSAYVCTVPLFAVGFGAGALAGLIAVLCGTVGLFIAFPASFGLFYVLTYSLPAIGLIFMAMRYRIIAEGKMEWASEGNLLAALTLYPCMVFIGVYVATMGHQGGLLAMTTDALENLSPQINQMIVAKGETVTPDMTLMIQHYLDMGARVAPALVMCAWLFSTLIAMAAGQGIVRQQGWSLRPVFSLSELHVPSWIIYAAALTGVAGCFAPAPYDYIGLNLALVLGVPFFFTGLAVVHAWALRTRMPTLALVVFYVVISIIVHLVLLVAILGAVDQWVDFRKRFANRPAN